MKCVTRQNPETIETTVTWINRNPLRLTLR
jgi:hypothetical protein